MNRIATSIFWKSRRILHWVFLQLDKLVWRTTKRRNNPVSPETRLIYDVGMHLGQDTEFYLAKGFRVVAIEANPKLVARAHKKFEKQVDEGQLTIVSAGIVRSESSEQLVFYIHPKMSEWSSFDKVLASRGGVQCQELKVPVKTLASIIATYGQPFYVKIDIEGHDRIALESMLEGDLLPEYVSIENGNAGMLNMLIQAGYDSFKYVSQRHVVLTRMTPPAQHGRFIKHVFSMGSSGPFGEETAGPWLEADKVRAIISRYFDPDGDQKTKDHQLNQLDWFDLHARRKSS